MSTDDDFEGDLRHRFDHALDGVQPSPDLYRRAEARVKRRSSARLVAGVAAVALVLGAGVVAVSAFGPSSEGLRVDPVAPPTPDQPTYAPSDDPIDGTSEQPTGEPTDAADASEAPTVEGEPHPVNTGEVAVIGVAADDVLNVRAAPGTDHDVVATLEPLADGVTATGEGRMLDGAVWVELDTGNVTGWVHAAFIAHTGATEDITSQVIEEHGSHPVADSPGELAMVVAGLRATQEPPSRVVISDGPHLGDRIEVTVDVVGFGDDSVRAERLVLFADGDSDGTVTLRSVEATTYCGRGVTDDELCL